MQENSLSGLTREHPIYESILRDICDSLYKQISEELQDRLVFDEEKALQKLRQHLKLVNIFHVQELRDALKYPLNAANQGSDAIFSGPLKGREDLKESVMVFTQGEYPTRGQFISRAQMLIVMPSLGSRLPLKNLEQK